jgi:hypothetical protein
LQCNGLHGFFPRLAAKVRPAEADDAHCPLGSGVSLDYVFAWQETRRVGGGNDIAYKNGLYVPDDPGCDFNAKTTVEARETFSGEVVIWHDGRILQLRKIERAQRRARCVAGAARTPHKPPADHPWRQFNKDILVR